MDSGTNRRTGEKPPPGWNFVHPVAVRFKDIDIGGHAHHSHALVYFEEARAAYWGQVVGKGRADEVDYILAEAAVRYRRRILYPETLQVSVRAAQIDPRRILLEYRGVDGEGHLALTGSTSLVGFDYAGMRPTHFPEETRERLRRFEEGGGSTGRMSGE